MTQEEKQLLLKDLCARLFYGVIISYKESKNDYHCWALRTLNAPGISKSDTAPDSDGEIEYTEQAGIGTRTSIRPLRLEKMLPYLRPMSSMTQEERDEIEEISHGWFYVNEDGEIFPVGQLTDSGEFEDAILPTLEWLNKKMFDYRGLIPIGLALEAPEDMYKIE